jgi:hypothetical protein
MPENYTDYKQHVDDDIEACIDNMGCQPILFVGSGFSRRYIKAPNWEELLIEMSNLCPNITKNYAYYKQSFKNEIDIGSSFVEPFKEWAWENMDEFPSDLFTTDYNSDIYLKYKISDFINKITPADPISDSNELKNELIALKSINPHAIITTNYDTLLQNIFNEYIPIIGQKILKYNTFSIGEIFKIHGCVSEPNSLILTRNDYDEFIKKKKYLSAKLLTFFAEHPLLFIGYSASDPNIRSILSDIDEIISEESELIPNIYLLQWKENISESDYPQRDTSISLDEHRNIRVKCIIANDFEWVFKAFSQNKPLESIHPKTLRALLARTYDIVRCDIPRKIIEVDFETLEHAVSVNGELGKIYGITSVSDATKVNAQFPYSLTQVAEKLGYTSWHPANELLSLIKQSKNIDIKASDNQYHISIKSGCAVQTRKYSQNLVDLLKLVKNGDEYNVTL